MTLAGGKNESASRLLGNTEAGKEVEGEVQLEAGSNMHFFFLMLTV